MGSTRSTVKLMNGEDTLRILSEQAPVGACIIQDGKFRYVNSFFSSATGYTADELVGRDSLEIVVPEDREMVRENTMKMLKREITSPYQFRVICKDNGIIWVMATVKSIQYRGRQAVLGNYMEITGRKQLEESLKDSEEKYRELADSITDIFFAMDVHLRYTYWNKASEILTGISAQDAIGRSLLEVFPDGPATRNAEKVYRNALKTQQPQTFMNGFDIGDRHYVFEISAYPSRGGISVFARDITERKQAEERLNQAEQEKDALLEEAPVAIIHTDLDGRITYVNKRFELESGYSREEIIGKLALQLGWFSLDTTQYFAQRMAARLRGRPAKHWETEFKCKDGRSIWIELEGKIVEKLGAPVGFQIIASNITERQEMEESLRQSEERYRTILEQMEDAYFEVDLGGHITFVNNSVCRDLGYSKEELIGMSYKNFTVEEDVESVFQVFNEVYQTGVPNKGSPWRTIRKDGVQGFAETSISLLRNHKGEVIGFRGVGRDITGRKQAEEALRRSEERYRTMLEEMEEGYYEVDLEGNFTFVNDAMTRILGYSRHELIGRNYKSYTPEEAVEPIFQAFNRVYRTGEILKWFPMPEIRKDGIRILAEDSVFPLRNEEGEITGFRGISRDITERRRMEEALRQSEENYRTLFEKSVVGKIVLDAETMKIVMANEAAAKTFKFNSVEEGIGQNPIDLIVPEDRERAIDVITKELFEQDLRITHEFRAITKDGKEIWLSTTGSKIMHESRLAGLICFTDVTEQKRQADSLILTDRLASLGELASGAAHELNNPLTSIIGFSQLLMEKEVPDDIRGDLKLINTEAQRAVMVTRNFLTFARKHAPMKEPSQLNNILEDVLRLRTHEHKANGIEVEKHLAPDLPEVMVDYFQMQQVFMNIIINAEYFMINAHNGGTLTITTKEGNDTLVILFTDDGPGIPPENLRRIFDPFFTTKEAGKGTGLGLSICHGIVTEHGGRIYATSHLGRGATIAVELPVGSRRP
jgi:two-component system, NtrC family, sensor kinase